MYVSFDSCGLFEHKRVLWKTLCARENLHQEWFQQTSNHKALLKVFCVLKQNSSSGLFCVKRDQLCRKRRKSITTDLQKKTNNRNTYHRTRLLLQGCCSVRPSKEMHILEYVTIPAYYSRPTKETHTIEQDCCCRVVAAERHKRNAYSRICNYSRILF